MTDRLKSLYVEKKNKAKRLLDAVETTLSLLWNLNYLESLIPSTNRNEACMQRPIRRLEFL